LNDGGVDKAQATHWIVYMSPMSKDPLMIPDRSQFVRLGSPIPILNTTASITTTATQSGYKFGTATANVAGFSNATNPGGVLQQGGAYARFDNDSTAMYLRTFGIATSALTVTGIDIEIGMAYNNAIGGDGAGIAVVLQRTDSGETTVSKQSRSIEAKIVGHPGGWKIFHLGGSFDTFTPSPSAWVGSDFFDSGAGHFRIFVRTFWVAAYLDYVKINIHYDGFAPGTIGANYRTVTYRSQVGTTVVDSAALPPPTGPATGAVYRGQMVLNSRTQRNGIFYSQVGFPEYYPKPYFMTFDSPKKDIVTNIKRVGKLLVVGLEDNIQRVNYLPTELDTDGQSGLAYEPIATDHGIAGPLAACVVDIPALGTVLAYASFKGVHYTDGIRSRFLNADLNWLALVKATTISNIQFVCYPAMNWIVMFYCPFGATHTRNTRAMIFDYSPDKLKDGPGGACLPAIGPMTVSARSACSATINGVDYFLTGHEASGFVYAEDQGNALPSGYYTQEDANPATHTTTKNVPAIRTRLFYAAGVERDTRAERTYVRYDNNGTLTTVADCGLAGSTVTKTGAFTSDTIIGQTVSGTGIRPGTIVIARPTNNTVTLSNTVEATQTSTLTFDTGTLEITTRGQGMRENLADIEAGYITTYEGNLNDIHLDNTRQALELRIRKAALPDGTLVDLSTPMRLHYFTSLISEEGMETSRS
jgi:hypothetical protein